VAEEYAPRLKAFGRTIVRSPEVAEEIAQETFVTAWRKKAQLRQPERLESWLFKITRHAALRKASALSFRMETAVDDEPLLALSGAAEDASARENILAEQSARLLEKALASLAPKRRDLLALRYFSEMGLAEIAETLDMPIGSVGTTIARALDDLRGHFAKQGLKREDLLP
jgi:RNA polymerase sigma-70 factor (ECF subfamily)